MDRFELKPGDPGTAIIVIDSHRARGTFKRTFGDGPSYYYPNRGDLDAALRIKSISRARQSNNVSEYRKRR